MSRRFMLFAEDRMHEESVCRMTDAVLRARTSWLADHDDLTRSLGDIFQSYGVIVGKRGDGRLSLDRGKFSTQIRKLKGAAFGSVLVQEEGRPGWYSYKEKMLRGYVRMQAETNGVELTGERPIPKQSMHVGNARNGYRGPSIPQGVRTGKSISEWDEKD